MSQRDSPAMRVIPPPARAGMEAWAADVVWAFAPEVTTWRMRGPDGELRYLKVSRPGQDQRLCDERDRMVWARPHLPVPEVVAYGQDESHEWLVTVGLPGVNATDRALKADPHRLVPLLAQTLRRFHEAPIEGCPFDSRDETLVCMARERVAAGIVTVHGFHRDLGVTSAADALARVEALRPADGHQDLVLCHGDYCLPNVLFEDWQHVGYVDLGKLGVADRWWDLAVATWSVTWNLGPGWEDLFLEAYGVRRDDAKQAFYRLLYDMVP